ncbi:MAG: hypothetical protein V3U29_08890 [Phycisphaeraceae bacterium]
MKRQYGKIMQRVAALMLGVFLILSPVAQAADNTGIGDVAGDGAALGDSNLFQLFSSGALTLVKTAFLTADQTPLTSGDTLPFGTDVDFMIYVNNKSDLVVADVTIEDVLDALFLYTAGTIRVNNATAECALAACTPAEELIIYNAARIVGAGTDGVLAGDSVSFTAGTTVDVGNDNQALNDQQDAAANSVLAVVFTVTVQ